MVQVSVYVFVPDPEMVTVWLPLDANVPVQPPDAVHAVALIVDQVIVVEPPSATLDDPNDSIGKTRTVFAWINPNPDWVLGDWAAIGKALLRNV